MDVCMCCFTFVYSRFGANSRLAIKHCGSSPITKMTINSLNQLRFFFDPVSPYAYLASTQLKAICQRTGAKLTTHPILFAGVLNHHGQLGGAEIPSKRRNTFTDGLRQARKLNVPFVGPPKHPFNPLLALRMCTASIDGEIRNELSLAVLRTCWAEGKDITNPEVLLRLADDVGADGPGLVRIAGTDEVKQKLNANTQQAISLGVFGVPTFMVRGNLFWGCDRLGFVEECLGPNGVELYDNREPQLIEPILNRPFGSVRRALPRKTEKKEE
eukprot:comp23942_c5_seq2/m.42327 comp23942_c5_seq2/g.42327  ORF comp23942_c5_seq2/g.42327 comp23942_c5_seq2/m.42327 type:complete len:271 (-) comp23942_c5_seq2:100-912(-)